jgi:hypothetical protein
METVATNNQLTVIDKSIEVFKSGSAILLSHQNRASKALVVGNNILLEWDKAYTIVDPDKRAEALAAIDQRSNKFLANCGVAQDEMQESRKAITQLMDMIKKMFTEEENKLDVKKDTVPAKIQLRRNAYAKQLHEEQERKRKLAEEKAAKAKEEVEIRSFVKNQIANCLLDFLSKKKIAVTNSFNSITLNDFDEKAGRLKLLPTAFPLDKLHEIIKYTAPRYYRHTDSEFQTIQGSEHAQYDFPSFYNEYGRQMAELKLSLLDQLPSKKEELERMAAADEAEKIRLENERLNREAAEKKRLEEETAAAKKAEEEKAELEKAAGTAQLLFDQTVDSSITTPTPETRQGYDIIVTHPAGWVEIFQFWFQREGCKMKIEDIGKKSLNQMKTYAEGVAKKDNVKIESKFLRYETSIKSVNRKAIA